MTAASVMHLLLHVAAPAAVAYGLYRAVWLRAWAVMMAGMLIDLDHLLANPIYDPNRCSIGFHPLHTWPAMMVYVALVFSRRTRWLGIGLLIHMLLDGVDCGVTFGWLRLVGS